MLQDKVSKWETGETIPDIDSLKKLAVLLEFSIDNALGIEIENDNDDKIEWLIIGGFIIGNTLESTSRYQGKLLDSNI